MLEVIQSTPFKFSLLFTERFRAVGFAISLVVIAALLALFVSFSIFRSHMLVVELSDANSSLVLTWRKIGEQTNYLLEVEEAMPGPEGRSIIKQIQKRIRVKLDIIKQLDARYYSTLDSLEKRRWLMNGLDSEDIKVLKKDVDPLLRAHIIEASSASIQLVRGRFSHWSTATMISFRSGNLNAPLRERASILGAVDSRKATTIWQALSVVALILVMVVGFIWYVLLRPAVKGLAEARHDLQLVLDSLPGMVASYDAEGYLLTTNARYQKRIGQDAVGRHVAEVVGPDLWGRVKDRFENAMQGIPSKFDIAMDTPSGIRIHSATYVPLTDTVGNVSQVVVLITDVQSRYDNIRALRESEEKHRITLDSIGEGVISTDVSGVITHINPIACELAGWRDKDAVGRPFTEVFRLVDQHSRQPADCQIEKISKENAKECTPQQSVLMSKDGREYIIKLSCAPIFSIEHEIVGVVLVCRDVAEEIALNERIIQSEKMRAIGQMAGGIAHDINNNLAVIRGYTEILEDQTTDDAVSQILNACDRAAGLIGKLRAFSMQRLENSESVDVKTLLEGTVDILRDTTDRRIEITTRFDDIDSCVKGNADLLQSAFMNIALNAVQAMQDAGHLQISMKNQELGDLDDEQFGNFILTPCRYLKITFKDDGPGIPKENLQRIFEPYFSTKEAFGTGMGLAMVFGTVLEHGGAITAHNAPEGGAVFTLLLPLLEHAEMPKITPAKTTEILGLNSLRVLLVDDEPELRRIWSILLTRAGCVVTCAEDGEHAMETINEASGAFDLVLLDLNMPKMSGLEVLERLKKLSPDVSVVVMTGFSEQMESKALSEPPVFRVLNKPFSLLELTGVLHEFVSSRTVH